MILLLLLLLLLLFVRIFNRIGFIMNGIVVVVVRFSCDYVKCDGEYRSGISFASITIVGIINLF